MGREFEQVFVLTIGQQNDPAVFEYVNEFERLLHEIGYSIGKVFYQNIDSINKATFVGKGKLEEIRDFYDSSDKNIKKIACAFELTAVQKKNIEKITHLTAFDRTQVILDIFDNNAKTREAKLQVEIAKLNYSKSRLVNEHAEYSQVTSGSGHNKGEGEKAIELERRRIGAAIHQRKIELEEIKNSRSTSRESRRKSILPKISIVGYTNAGKSTLMNRLLEASKASKDKNVLQKDALFATLETNTRLINVYPYPNFLLTDTVGFISDLPIYLVDAFRSTLEEITESDMLIHVVDSSSPFNGEQIETTNNVLKDLNVDTENSIYLYNKYDLLLAKGEGGFSELPKKNERYVTLANDEDLKTILEFICSSFSAKWNKRKLLLPLWFNVDGFNSENYVLSKQEKSDGFEIIAKLNPITEYKYKDYFID